ncbi:hypothetical protein [Haladaptatus salinisoli]|uniref:hypothetical protein n=1 Tax=Haladaptatus salinisoli TaxID=2884876 RepID=UPI001D0AF773|nr:hypothetical protein [Haladaptatus salinisoli]
MNRRTLVASLPAVFVGGCLGRSTPASAPETTKRERPGEREKTGNNEPSLTDWERSTDCGETHDSMHDSVIRVERVRSEIGDGYAPIRFSTLSSAEKAILRTVVEEGGYGTCDPSDAFHRFVERVGNRAERQAEDRHAYLERDGTYYGLYVELSDQVFVY